MKYILVLLTWIAPIHEPEVEGYEPPDLKRQEINQKTEKKCESMVDRLKRGWITADDEFGYSMNCQLNPEWKPKGQRK